MENFHMDGFDLEYRIQGSGESLVLIHGSIVADAFPLCSPNPALQVTIV